MARRKSALSTVVSLMSEEAQDEVREQAGIVSTIPLNAILPDPMQPRQLLPEDLSDALVVGELRPTAALQAWLDRGVSQEATPAMVRNLEELQRLADSIAQHGLINPISVRRVPGHLSLPENIKYLIVTGERRYWAHVLLVNQERQIQEGVETSDPARIKATIASEGVSIRAHQIIENLLREDIDAVEKATGFVALRQELSGRDLGITEGEVNHGSPLVSWKQVEDALGISSRYRIYVTSILGLAPDAQAIIQQHGLTERMVRPISQKLKKHPDLQLEALNKILTWQKQQADGDENAERALTASVASLVDSLVKRDEKKKQAAAPTAVAKSPDPQQLYTKVQPILKLLMQLSEPELLSIAEALAHSETNQNLVADLQLLEQHLAQLLDAVESQQDTLEA